MNQAAMQIPEMIRRSKPFGWILEPEAKKLLQSYSIPTTNFVWIKERESITKSMATLTYPVVCKVVSPLILHKTEANGVIVGISDENSVFEAFDRFSVLDRFQGILVEEMVEGLELIIGSKNDAQFGPVVLVGIGGISVEVYEDIAIRLAPISAKEAADALKSLKGAELLSGFRGRPAVDLERLSTMIEQFSKLAYDLKDEIESIDCNPVFADANHVTVADARMLLKGD